jgi:hypothetical protein
MVRTARKNGGERLDPKYMPSCTIHGGGGDALLSGRCALRQRYRTVVAQRVGEAGADEAAYRPLLVLYLLLL